MEKYSDMILRCCSSTDFDGTPLPSIELSIASISKEVVGKGMFGCKLNKVVIPDKDGSITICEKSNKKNASS